MITDKLLRVSEDQAITTTAFSTDTIDLGLSLIHISEPTRPY